MGERFIKVNFSELNTVTFFCPACGTGLKFDLGNTPSVIGCSCGRVFPQNERTIIGNLMESFRMYKKIDGSFKVEFEVKE